MLLNDGGGGGVACQVVGEGGECVQPAGRGRGGGGGGRGRLLQLAHTEGTPAPGDAACACGACVNHLHTPSQQGVRKCMSLCCQPKILPGVRKVASETDKSRGA